MVWVHFRTLVIDAIYELRLELPAPDIFALGPWRRFCGDTLFGYPEIICSFLTLSPHSATALAW